jgi:hypothetical protein
MRRQVDVVVRGRGLGCRAVGVVLLGVEQYRVVGQQCSRAVAPHVHVRLSRWSHMLRGRLAFVPCICVHVYPTPPLFLHPDPCTAHKTSLHMCTPLSLLLIQHNATCC